jgi:hypothetical protein
MTPPFDTLNEEILLGLMSVLGWSGVFVFGSNPVLALLAARAQTLAAVSRCSADSTATALLGAAPAATIPSSTWWWERFFVIAGGRGRLETDDQWYTHPLRFEIGSWAAGDDAAALGAVVGNTCCVAFFALLAFAFERLVLRSRESSRAARAVSHMLYRLLWATVAVLLEPTVAYAVRALRAHATSDANLGVGIVAVVVWIAVALPLPGLATLHFSAATTRAHQSPGHEEGQEEKTVMAVVARLVAGGGRSLADDDDGDETFAWKRRCGALVARQRETSVGMILELLISCAAGVLRGLREVDGTCADTGYILVALFAGASIFHNAFYPYKSAVENTTASWVHLVWLSLAIVLSVRSFTIPSEIDAARESTKAWLLAPDRTPGRDGPGGG